MGFFGKMLSNSWFKAGVRGGAHGLVGGMLAGATMDGDQSQLGAMGLGIGLGVLGNAGFARRGMSKLMRSPIGAPGRGLGKILASNKGFGEGFAKTYGRAASPRALNWMGQKMYRGGLSALGLGSAGLIGSTILESNQPY